MRALWTFEDQDKLDKFLPVLQAGEIGYEINSKKGGGKTNQLTVSVDEGDYEQAKRLLMRHKKRKSSK